MPNSPEYLDEPEQDHGTVEGGMKKAFKTPQDHDYLQMIKDAMGAMGSAKPSPSTPQQQPNAPTPAYMQQQPQAMPVSYTQPPAQGLPQNIDQQRSSAMRNAFAGHGK